MSERMEANGDEQSPEGEDLGALAARAAAEARDARASVLRSFQRLKAEGVEWGEDSASSADRDQRRR